MSHFNIRVYGIWFCGPGQVLVSREKVKGNTLLKFPGGGLELGEGTIDCLKREWQEELGIKVEVIAHYYTTDFYQPSFFDDSQVISIYYIVRPTRPLDLPVILGEESFYAEAVSNLPHVLSLPIDRVVGTMLQKEKSSCK